MVGSRLFNHVATSCRSSLYVHIIYYIIYTYGTPSPAPQKDKKQTTRPKKIRRHLQCSSSSSSSSLLGGARMYTCMCIYIYTYNILVTHRDLVCVFCARQFVLCAQVHPTTAAASELGLDLRSVHI